MKTRQTTKVERFYSPQQIHDRWGINPHLIRSECAAGRLNYKKIGNNYCITESWLAEWQNNDVTAHRYVNNGKKKIRPSVFTSLTHIEFERIN
jgi:hypothetical protein